MRKMMSRKQPDVITKEPGGGGPFHNFSDATWKDGYRQCRRFSDSTITMTIVYGAIIARCIFAIMTASDDPERMKMFANFNFLFMIAFLISDDITSFVNYISEYYSKQLGFFCLAMKMFIPTLTAAFAWCSFIVMTESGIPEKAKMLVIIGFHLIAVFLVARIIASFAFPKDHSD